MAKPGAKHKHRREGRRPSVERPNSGSLPHGPLPSPSPAVAAGRYDAPGDDPIAIASPLKLQEPFRIEPAWVSRLERRDVRPKEAFTIRDVTGDYFRASLKQLSAAGGVAVPYERMERSPESTLDLTLACAVLARQRMIFVMQKATELGVTRVVPLVTDHSVAPDGLEHERANAWPAQVVRAAKQCRRGSLPEVLRPTSLDDFLHAPAFCGADACVVLDDRSTPDTAPAVAPRRVVLLIGPEGGFSDGERARLAGKTRAWVLGGRILRAETAVFVGLTAVHLTWGDFKR